jgi:hypothetical protein
MADTPSPPPPDLEDLEALVLQVFARVWREFGVADADYCEATIGSLTATSVAEGDILSTESESVAAPSHDTRRPISRPPNVDESILEPSKPRSPASIRERTSRRSCYPQQ